MTAAAEAFRSWSKDEEKRRQALKDCAEAIDEHAEEVARLQTLEQGKPLKDSLGEVGGAAYWFRELAAFPIPHDVLRDDENGRVEVRRKPLGVVGSIAPWNYPVFLAAMKIAPALLAGNTVVLKPSPYTPLATLKLGEVLREVLPPGVLNVVSGGDDLGAAITAHPTVRNICFTGSVETGKKVAAAAAPDLKRIVLECRRRVKEQQKRVGAAEFRNTHFSYTMGPDDVEKFVTTPELQSADEIGSDPLPPGEVWGISPGSNGEHPGLFKVDVTVGPGSGVRILNKPSPAPFTESVRYAEQNLYVRARELVGDLDPRSHEFSVQLRASDAAKLGGSLGLPVLLALCSSLLKMSLQGGLIAVGGLNLGGGIDPIYNAVGVAELAIEKGAKALLVPISARRQLNELSDEMAMKLSINYFADAREALLKAVEKN